MHLRNDYEGERNCLTPLVMAEFQRALRNENGVIWDENCQLQISSPCGTTFCIFVDCGDFDYFEWIEFPLQDDILRFDYGHPVCRELEYNIREPELELFNKLVQW